MGTVVHQSIYSGFCQGNSGSRQTYNSHFTGVKKACSVVMTESSHDSIIFLGCSGHYKGTSYTILFNKVFFYYFGCIN